MYIYIYLFFFSPFQVLSVLFTKPTDSTRERERERESERETSFIDNQEVTQGRQAQRPLG